MSLSSSLPSLPCLFSGNDQLRSQWENQRAQDLGIMNHGPNYFTIDGKSTPMFSVVEMAIIYGLAPTDIITFGNSWAKIKSELRCCKDFRVFCQRGVDFITRKLFDQCVVQIINSPFAIAIVDSQQQESLPVPAQEIEPQGSVVNENDEESSLNVLTILPTAVSTVEELQAGGEGQWSICSAKRFEHERLLRTMGNSRGNYIAQIGKHERATILLSRKLMFPPQKGPLDFKFGSTDRSILDRTTEHVKDFPHFYLIFAEHCANTQLAESQFKSDPLIKQRRKNVKTERNNHTEIVSVDAEVTESTLKALYLKYIKEVDTKERFVLNAKYAASSSPPSSALSENAEESTSNQCTSMIQPQRPILAESPPRSSSDAKTHYNLEVLRLVQDHEFRMKKLEWEQTKWSSIHMAGYKNPHIMEIPPKPKLSPSDPVSEPPRITTNEATGEHACESSGDVEVMDDMQEDECESELSEVDETVIEESENEDEDATSDHVRDAETFRKPSPVKRSTTTTKSPQTPKKPKTKPCSHTVMDAASSIRSPKTTMPAENKKQQRRKQTLLKISTFNEKPTAEFRSIREAANSCQTYEYRRLANAIKTGVPYKSYRWRLVQQPSI